MAAGAYRRLFRHAQAAGVELPHEAVLANMPALAWSDDLLLGVADWADGEPMAATAGFIVADAFSTQHAGGDARAAAPPAAAAAVAPAAAPAAPPAPFGAPAGMPTHHAAPAKVSAANAAFAVPAAPATPAAGTWASFGDDAF
jgi:hypothetical protein